MLVTGPRSQFERVVPPDQSFEPSKYAGRWPIILVQSACSDEKGLSTCAYLLIQ